MDCCPILGQHIIVVTKVRLNVHGCYRLLLLCPFFYLYYVSERHKFTVGRNDFYSFLYVGLLFILEKRFLNLDNFTTVVEGNVLLLELLPRCLDVAVSILIAGLRAELILDLIFMDFLKVSLMEFHL